MTKTTPQFLAQAGKGRPKGSPNKTTKLAKQAIAEAFEKLGGTEALVTWAQADDDNLKVFYASIWTKIIPIQNEHSGVDGEAIQIEQKVREDADVVSGAIASLAARARTSAVDGSTQH